MPKIYGNGSTPESFAGSRCRESASTVKGWKSRCDSGSLSGQQCHRNVWMAIISFRSDEIHCKIVYYGPGRGGKTTNLIAIHKALGDQVRGELLSIDTSGDRTLFFDFLPMDLGSIGKFRIKISLYTVPGQVRYNDTRKLVLKGVDGIVFVADSLEARKHNNVESLQNLHENLKELGKSIQSLPVVLQYNKRDLAGSKVAIIPLEEMDKELNPENYFPSFSASALKGDGVRETFKKVCMMTVVDVSTRLLKDKGMSLTGS